MKLIFLDLLFEFIIVIISAGPRNEGKYISGISHFLEKLAFMVKKKKQYNNFSLREILLVD